MSEEKQKKKMGIVKAKDRRLQTLRRRVEVKLLMD
jgi:hypothetical protein